MGTSQTALEFIRLNSAVTTLLVKGKGDVEAAVDEAAASLTEFSGKGGGIKTALVVKGKGEGNVAVDETTASLAEFL